MQDLVSIITPVYNSEKYLQECMNSVINQTYQNWEHLLVDDCSTDNSTNIIKEFSLKDPRIKLFEQEINGGAGIARNRAIKEASGKFIAFLDSDDKWHLNKLAKQVSFMTVNNYSFSYTSYMQVFENEIDFSKNNVIRAKDRMTYNKALYGNPIGCLTAVYNASILGKHYMPDIRKRQDYALWLEILKETDGYGLDEILSYYRVREDSISSNKMSLIKYHWQLYRKIEKISIINSVYYLSVDILKQLMKIIKTRLNHK